MRSHNTLACTCADLRKLELACAETDLRKHASCHANFYLPTSPQLSDRQDEECIEEQSSNTIYERQMLPKKRGSFPLWNPQPNAFAPLTHRRKGVLIGDLGRVTADGAFDVLFNICKAAGHPDNPDELPDGFTPLSLNANDIHGFQEYISGDYIASASVTKLRLGSVYLGESSIG